MPALCADTHLKGRATNNRHWRRLPRDVDKGHVASVLLWTSVQARACKVWTPSNEKAQKARRSRAQMPALAELSLPLLRTPWRKAADFEHPRLASLASSSVPANYWQTGPLGFTCSACVWTTLKAAGKDPLSGSSLLQRAWKRHPFQVRCGPTAPLFRHPDCLARASQSSSRFWPRLRAFSAPSSLPCQPQTEQRVRIKSRDSCGCRGEGLAKRITHTGLHRGVQVHLHLFSFTFLRKLTQK